jgi:hypothetical protein
LLQNSNNDPRLGGIISGNKKLTLHNALLFHPKNGVETTKDNIVISGLKLMSIFEMWRK